MTVYHLAQFNIARMLAPLDSPQMAGFMGQLDTLNALAEQSEGFVWRYVSADTNDSTTDRPYEDDTLITNLSVWQSLEHLHQYTYYSDHVGAFRQRGDWFERPTEPIMVLWWLPAGQRPTLGDAIAKLDYLREHGVSAAAFTFKQSFPPPAQR